MVPRSTKKVKSIAKRVVSGLGKGVTLPERKFALEMTLGMLRTGSCNVTRIAASLGEESKTRHTLKRMSRMLMHDGLLERANETCLKAAVRKIDKNTVLALDGGDIVHQYGRKFEHQAKVHDGSSKENGIGFWLNQVTGYNEVTHETFPILLRTFSTKEPGFVSANKEAFGMIDQVHAEVGSLGLWVLDRGYDGGSILKHLLDLRLRFVVRMTEKRDIWVRGQRRNIREVAEGVNRRVKFSSYARFGAVKSTLRLGDDEHEVTVIAYKARRNPDVMILLTPGWIKSTVELKRRIRAYFRRWGVEESYRFEKQGFGIEQATVRRYARLKTLLGLTLLSWLVLVKINDQSKLRHEVNNAARMEKNRRRHLPRFMYYRLLLGVKNLLASIPRMLSWRHKRRSKADRQQMGQPLLPFMPKPGTTRFELEYAS